MVNFIIILIAYFACVYLVSYNYITTIIAVIIMLLIALSLVIKSIIKIENKAKREGKKVNNNLRKKYHTKIYDKSILEKDLVNRFDDFYKSIKSNDELKKENIEIKENNKENKSLQKHWLTLFFCYCITIVLFRRLGVLIVLSIICIVFYIVLSKVEKKEENFINNYKKKIITPLIKSAYENCNYTYIYDEYRYLQLLDDYDNAYYADSPYNTFLTDDYIEGKLSDNTFFSIADISALEESYSNSISGKDREPSFVGAFSKIELKKDLGCIIQISSKDFDSYSGKGIANIKSDNVELAKEIISSELSNYLIDFNRKYKIHFDITFNHNKVFIRFFTGVMFEPNRSEGLLEEDELFDYYVELNYIIEMMEKVNNSLINK